MSDSSTEKKLWWQLWQAAWWLCVYVLLVVVLLVGVLAMFGNAAKTHWSLVILLALFSGALVFLGIGDLRAGRLKTLPALGVIVLMIAITAAVFASASFALYKLGLAQYEGDAISAGRDQDTFFTFIAFYGWLFLDLLPGLEATKTLQLDAPLRPTNLWAGLPLLAFRAAILLLLLKEIKRWWERRGVSALPPSQDKANSTQ